jgi:hypothetical protein
MLVQMDKKSVRPVRPAALRAAHTFFNSGGYNGQGGSASEDDDEVKVNMLPRLQVLRGNLPYMLTLRRCMAAAGPLHARRLGGCQRLTSPS